MSSLGPPGGTPDFELVGSHGLTEAIAELRPSLRGLFVADRRWPHSPGRTAGRLALYWSRSVVAGSILTARIIGGSEASKVAARMVNHGSASIAGSVGFT